MILAWDAKLHWLVNVYQHMQVELHKKILRMQIIEKS